MSKKIAGRMPAEFNFKGISQLLFYTI